MTLKGWWPNNGTPLFSIEFSDGSRWASSFLWSKSLSAPLVGTSGDDIISGTSGNDTIDGGAGNDWIFGGDGGDVLMGGVGVDHLVGEAGNDSYVVDNVGDVILENADEGNDQVESSVSYALSAHVEVLTLTGTSAINGTGNSEANTIHGNAGNNRLDGGAGADDLIGGGGRDAYVVDNAGDNIYDGVYGDGDTVESSINWTLAPSFENLTLTGTDAINGTGNWYGNVLTGNSANNLLDGRFGNDVYVFGRGGGQDTISEAADGTVGKQNVLRFMAGINPSDISLVRLGADLEVSIIGSTDKVTIKNFCFNNNLESPENPIQRIEFADNTVWDIPTLQLAVFSNHAPSGALTITGTAAQNQVLVASNTLSDADGLGPIAYQWQCSSDGTAWSDISGATTSSFALAEAQVGMQLRIAASYTDGQGLLESVVSSTTAVVANVNDAPTGSVTLNGTAVLGQVLTVSNTLGDVDGLGTVAYQWQSSSDGTAWSDISGSTASSFTLAETQVGEQVRVAANYTDGHGMVEFVASSATTAVANVNDAPTGSVIISGEAVLDQVLSVTNTLADADGLGAIAYQWKSSVDGTTWSAIDGAIGSDFTLTETQVGQQVRVAASYTDGHGTPESMLSGSMNVVSNINHAPVFLGGASGGVVSTDLGSANDWAYGLTVQADGKYLVTGQSNVDGYSDFTLARYNSNGTLDSSFNGNGKVTTAIGPYTDDCYSVAVQADGKILAAGLSSQPSTYADFAVLRYNSSGSLDASFGANGKVTTDIGGYWDQAYSMAVQADGKIVLAGMSSGNSSSISDFALVRYNVDGSLDTSFDGDGKVISSAGYFQEQLESVTVQSDGKILAAGWGAGEESSNPDLVLLRYNSDGTLDSSFGGSGIVTADFTAYDLGRSITVQSDGKVLVYGTSGNGSVLLRYNSDGSLDTGFGIDGKVENTITSSGAGNAISLQVDGKILLTGTIYAGASAYDLALVRYNSDGSLDTGFGVGGKVTTAVSLAYDAGNSVTVEADGKIVVAGGRDNGDGSGTDFVLVRYNPDGSLDTAFGSAGLIHDQTLNKGSAASFTIPANLFVDTDAGDTLTFAATKADGSALPVWLSFDPATRTFSGTPANGDVGSFSLKVTATDQAGESAVSNTFNVEVVFVNSAPTGVVAIGGNAAQNQVLTVSNTLADVDGLGAIDYQWQSSIDGANWSAISGATENDLTLLQAQVGKQIRVVASYTDGFGAVESKASDASSAIVNVNDAPVLLNPITDQVTTQGEVFSAIIPTNAFADIDTGDVLSYSAQLADGSALPAWLSFNAATRTFQGTPASYGTISVRVTAADSGGLMSNDVFDIVIERIDKTLNGTAGADTLTGGVGNDTLYGLGGNDTLNGMAGNDLLDGGTGADRLSGGTGDDTYIVDSTSDVVTEAASAGADLVQSSVTHTLATNVENLTLSGIAAINGTGNTQNNLLVGNGAANVINGGTGADTMSGGLGNDTFVVDNIGDVVIENVTEGTDLVQSSLTYALGADLENLTLTGSAAINGTGNDLNNTLTGNAGDNVLNGGIGLDKLIGGAGNDTYYVSTGDTVTEAASAGTDTVISDATWTLGSNQENLTLTGATAINGTGNTLNNRLIGNSAANTLSGGTGTDTMQGGAGNDTYVIDNVGDIVIENLNEGTDLVKSSVTYTLSANVEDLTLTGTTAINATGNALDNVLTGNSAANTLNGGAGNDTLNGAAGADTMQGGLGDDTYTVDNTLDVVTENASEGIDRVNSSITLTLAANVEVLALTGTSALNGTGNALNNLLRGNTGSNTLNGGTGNDILEGGAGNDILTDTSGTALFNGGAGTDTITGGVAAEIFLGGLGNDTYTTGAGNDIVLFNKGDGQDTFAAGGTGSDAVSLGGGVLYSDLTFSKATNDLVLKVGATDQITFKNWYATTPSKPVLTLQMMAEAMADFAPGGADPLRDQKVENFNFAGLAGAFDTARVANPGLTSWALTNALVNFQLAGSDSAALGGDLAYQYGRNGTLAGIGITPAFDVLNSAALGAAAQTLTPLAGLQTGTQRLS